MSFVVDSSMALAWHYQDEDSPHSSALFDRTEAETLVVPQFWYVEIANVLHVNERRKRSSVEETAEFVTILRSLDVEVDSEGSIDVFARVLPLARAHKLTVYDALYLELAERRGLPLASYDADLTDAARAVGVTVL